MAEHPRFVARLSHFFLNPTQINYLVRKLIQLAFITKSQKLQYTKMQLLKTVEVQPHLSCNFTFSNVPNIIVVLSIWHFLPHKLSYLRMAICHKGCYVEIIAPQKLNTTEALLFHVD